MKKFILFLFACLLISGTWAQVGPVSTIEEAQEEVTFLETAIMQRLESKRKDVDYLMNRMLVLYQQQYTTRSAQYADCLMWCAMICAEIEDNNQATMLMEKSVDLFNRYGKGPFNGKDTVHEILYQDVKGQIAYTTGLEFKAIKCFEKSCKLKELYFGPQNKIYLKAVLDLSKLYSERLQGGKSRKYHNIAFNAYVDIINQEFCNLSESERTVYWNTAYKYILKTLDLAYKNNEGNMPSATYDALLLSKGLLLNTTTSFENFINESGNLEAIRSLQYKKTLATLDADQSVLDSIDYSILKTLREAGMEYKIPQLSIKWQQVQNCLGEDDLAIEFFKTSSNEYGAVLLKRAWKKPKLVKLSNIIRIDGKLTRLNKALQSDILEHYSKEKGENLWNIGRAVWCDDILKHFPTTKDGKVYFSADGELLVMGIEYLPMVNPAKEHHTIVQESSALFLPCIADYYSVYRLSSTRELVMQKEQLNSQNAVIYGGLYYDMTMEDLIADAQNQESSKGKDLAYVQNGRTRGGRGASVGIEYLEGTAIEADSIISILDHAPSKSFVTTYYNGNLGTEASFKALSGRQINILHLATHGFFYGANDPTFKQFALGDNPLVRSGLFLAGADNKWFGEPIPEGVDDGFLTSLEVANQDFRGVNMVVLSACETAQGNVSSDGVFGLQRGFKMSGAESIMMSLWKVDDEATCLLMEEFYKNWINGKSKREALSLAQQVVRAHTEKGWDNPRFWAAFILLDGLD